MFLLSLGLVLAASPVDSTTLDLWRAFEGGDKLYVQVGLPDGTSGLFLVDTGAAVSVINDDTAERLGLEAQDVGGRVAGLSGSVSWRRATLSSLQLGGFRLDNVDVATGVPGVPDHLGAIPVDGILGHNVWSHWTVVVDYPADRLELHRGGTYKPRGKSEKVEVAGNRIVVEVGIEAGTKAAPLNAPVAIELDTGAGDTSLWCQTGEAFRPITTLGVEPVFGIGAALDKVPDFQFLTETRHIPVRALTLGGRRLPRSEPLRWSSPDDPGAAACDVARGLIGYQTLRDWRVVIDYAANTLTLETPRQRRTFDAAAAWLAEDFVRHGDDPAFAADRAKVLIVHDELPEARTVIQKALDARGADPELLVLAARVDRYDGNDSTALDRISSLSPVELVRQGFWGEVLGLLITLHREPEALSRAEASLTLPVDDPDIRQELLVGLSDALLAADRPADAQKALDEAIRVDQGGSGFLFRRAIVAIEAGDRYGAISTLRDLLDVYPIGGYAMWLYALTAEPGDRATFRADLERALGRLHPDAIPFDFVGAAYAHLGATDEAAAAFAEGYARDCKPLRRGPTRDNCDAWYWAMEGSRLDEAAAAIGRAVKADPKNSAYRDTAAVVASVRGDVKGAAENAHEAARLSPDDPYLIWQSRRFAKAAAGAL